MRRRIDEADDPEAKKAELIDALPQDHRRLHRGRQRHDRRRHRPARDARDDLPALEMAEKKKVERPLEEERSGTGMSVDHPVVITCAISGAIANREQCPAIPYTPAEYAAEARRIVHEGGVHYPHPCAQTGRHAELRGPGLPGDQRRDPRRGRRRGDHQLLNRGRSASPSPSGSSLPARLPARSRGAEHGLDELREVLAHPESIRLQRWSSRTPSTRSSRCSKR